MNYGRGLPYNLREGIALNQSSFCVLKDSWSTTGTQEFPFRRIIVNQTDIDYIVSESTVIYIGDLKNSQVITFLTGHPG